MADSSTVLPKKSRAKGSKSTRGCYTCKVRHVKCDEAKPICSRCGKTGRSCEGFGYGKLFRSHSDDCIGPLSLAMSCRPSQSREQYRCLEYFRRNALPRLKGFDRQSRFWDGMVFQFSESSPAVLHAILALSSIYEYLDDSSKDKCGWNGLVVQHYNRSIRCLRSAPTSQPIQFTLTCCILLITFESARNDYQKVLLHLQSGLNILKVWRTAKLKTTPESLDREEISEMFRRFDMQATTFLSSRQPNLSATAGFEGPEKEFRLLKSFSTLHDAQTFLENIEIRLFYILTTKPLALNLSWLEYSDLAAARQVLLRGLKAQFAQWKIAFDDFSAREKENIKARDLQLALLLDLHYQTTSLMLDLKVDPSSISFLDEQCIKINDLSKKLIYSLSTSKLTFVVHTGIIAPLYFAATSTITPHIRKQSIDLLRLVSWKEGLWDSKTVIQIAENLSMVKDSGIVGVPVTGGVPELAQVYLSHSAQETWSANAGSDSKK